MQIVPGGVADADAGIVYVQGSSGAIDAVDLSTGATRWSTSAPGRPLAVDGAHLLVEIVGNDGVRLAVSTTAARPTIGASVPVVLPAWAVASAAGAVTFSSSVSSCGRAGFVRYHWTVQRRRSGGMHAPRGRGGAEGEIAPEAASGDLLVEIATGKQQQVEPVAGESLPYATEHGTSRTPWDVDGATCAFASEPRDGASMLTVRCLAADGAAQRTLAIAAAPIVPRLSTDGRLVAIERGAKRSHTVRLPAGTTGPVLPAAVVAAPFAVVRSRVLTSHAARETAAGPRGDHELRAWSLGGTLKWRHALYAPPWQPPRP